MRNMKELEWARSQIVMENPFFGTLCLFMPLKEHDATKTIATDGKAICFNSKWVKNIVSENGREVLKGLLLHEILHVSLKHLWRRQDRDFNVFNEAADYAANQIVIDIGYKLPEGVLYNPDFKGKSAEEIYRILQKQQDNSSQTGDRPNEQKRQDKDADGGKNDKDWQDGKQKNDSGGKSSHEKKDSNDETGNEQTGNTIDDHSGWGKIKEDEKEWDKKILRAAYTSQMSKARGDLPGEIKRMVDEITNPKVDWRSALAAFLQPSKYDYSFSPPDRRFLNEEYGEIILPDFNDEGIENIVIAIDTSGSINDKVLNQFMAEVKTILSSYSNVRGYLVTCDAKVQDWWEINSDTPVKIDIKGRGGTSFIPVFEEVKRRKIVPSALVYLTDGEGIFPELPPPFPVMWVLVRNRYKNVPWGQKIYFDV